MSFEKKMPRAPNRAPRNRQRAKRGNKQKAPTAIVGRSAHADLRYRTPLFPPKFKKVLTYSDVGLTVTGTSGLVGSYFFSANGCFDPDITGTGHQPIGFDTMMEYYNHYTVISSKITVTALNNSASGLYGAGGIYLSPDTTSITSPSRLIENGTITWKPLYPIGVVGSIIHMNLDCNVATYFGRFSNPREILQDTDLYGTAAANPNDQVYFAICAFSDAGANTIQMSFVVEIEYTVIFWEVRKESQS